MTEIEIGKEYRLLPGAEFRDGEPSQAQRHGVTRVRVTSGPNRHGDYWLVGLDGQCAELGHYLAHARFLAPLDDPAAEAPPLLGPPSPQTMRLMALKEARELLGDDRCDAVSLVHVAAYILGEEAGA